MKAKQSPGACDTRVKATDQKNTTPPSIELQSEVQADDRGFGRLRAVTCKNLVVGATSPTRVGSVLARSTFVTSRLADFASPEELTRQIGHPPALWPVVILKELVDNALDECERAGVAPVITITVGDDSICVSDNGDGIPAKTVRQILNYANRASSNAAYVSPTRGQQGNALQTLLAMGHALTGEPGVTIIESRGVRHRIAFSIDLISREPRLDHQSVAISAAPGTKVMVFLPVPPVARSIELSNAAFDFSWVNPHLTLTFTAQDGDDDLSFEATEPSWTKWTPTDPTSAHWYDLAALKILIAAEVNKARQDRSTQRTVSDFLAEFRGLSGTGKRRDICQAINASGEHLDALFDRDDAVIQRLLDAMKAASNPLKPRDLGVIGEDHVLAVVGGDSSERYKQSQVDVDGVPYLIEAGFGHRAEASRRTLVSGLNWSISVGGDPFRRLGFGQSLGSILSEQHAGPLEPIALFLHLASPRLTFLDKGKSAVDLPVKVNEAIVSAVKSVTAAWAKQRKAEERDRSARLRRNDAMTAASKPMSIKDAAFKVMAMAYTAASDNGKLPANARQIYYAARPEILRLAKVERVDSKRFTQELLIDYMNDHPDECARWDVVFSDRGHFVEPHTGLVVGLGTLAVRQYVGGYAKPALIEGGFVGPCISTRGPEGRIGGLLYIEKEGFEPLLRQARIGDRFDLAIMSCKGMSVTAARELVDRTCARFKVPLYILHDFDVAGFSIAATLHTSNRRFKFGTVSGEDFKVVDFGLRLADVQRLDLDSESVVFGKESITALRNRLRINGATESEIRFLLGERRVELNAMTSRQFVDFLEAKLAEHGVGKVIPKAETLNGAYQLFERGKRAKAIVEKVLAAAKTEEIAVPADLEKGVRAYLAKYPEVAWDQAVAILVLLAKRP